MALATVIWTTEMIFSDAVEIMLPYLNLGKDMRKYLVDQMDKYVRLVSNYLLSIFLPTSLFRLALLITN